MFRVGTGGFVASGVRCCCLRGCGLDGCAEVPRGAVMRRGHVDLQRYLVVVYCEFAYVGA